MTVQCPNCLSYCKIENEDCFLFRCWNCFVVTWCFHDSIHEYMSSNGINDLEIDYHLKNNLIPISETEIDLC